MDRSTQTFFLQRGSGCRFSRRFRFLICWSIPEIFAIEVERCQKTRKILDDFLPSQIFGGGHCNNCAQIITPASQHVPWKNFCEDTPTSLEVIGAHTLNFKSNFKVSRINFFRGSPFAVVVCASKCWSICSHVKISGSSTPQGPKIRNIVSRKMSAWVGQYEPL